jgi:hypothetical protein
MCFYRLGVIDKRGRWVEAVDLNIGRQHQRFVKGPWKAGYELGTYGLDTKANTVWAVINYVGDFAALNLDYKHFCDHRCDNDDGRHGDDDDYSWDRDNDHR